MNKKVHLEETAEVLMSRSLSNITNPYSYATGYGRTLRTTGPVGTYNELWKVCLFTCQSDAHQTTARLTSTIFHVRQGLTLQFEIYDRRDGLVLYSACGFVDIYECDYSASVGLDCDRRETPCRPFSIADREPLGNGQVRWWEKRCFEAPCQ